MSDSTAMADVFRASDDATKDAIIVGVAGLDGGVGGGGAKVVVASGEVSRNGTNINHSKDGNEKVMVEEIVVGSGAVNDDLTEEDDVKFQLAKAMALAIQNNPNLTPTEIHELMATTTGSSTASGSIAGGGNIGGGVNRSVGGVSASASVTSAGTFSVSGRVGSGGGAFGKKKVVSSIKGTFRESSAAIRRGLNFSDMLKGSMNNNYNNTAGSSNNATAVTGTTSFVDEYGYGGETSTFVSPSTEKDTSFPPNFPIIESDSNSSLTVTSDNNDAGISSPNSGTRITSLQSEAQNDQLTTGTTESFKVSSAPFVRRNRANSKDGGIVSGSVPFPSPLSVQRERPTSVSTTGSEYDGLVIVPTTVSPKISLTNTTPLLSTKASLGGVAAAATASIHTLQQHNPQNPTTRLVGICWKRRGGFGKYNSNAWERRRIELQGTKLYYYANSGDETNNTNSGRGDETSLDPSIHTVSSSDHLQEQHASVGGITTPTTNKKSTWFEQATALATFNSALGSDGAGGAPGSASSVSNSNTGKARGSFDIAKEKASVHASMGHSGAPSPFALSIVVKGETKWKFCFDQHKEQMEWLAAISDIVVQTSVDTYNIQLLDAADPASGGGGISGEYTSGPRPPPPLNIYAANAAALANNRPTEALMPFGNQRMNRLWMMENYFIRSYNFSDATSSNNVDDDMALVPKRRRHRNKKEKSLCVGTSTDDEEDNGSEDDEDDDDDDDDQIYNIADARQQSNSNKKDTIALDSEGSNILRTVAIDDALDHTAAKELAVALSEKTWVLPQQHLRYALLTFNLAIVLGRSSSIDGFWYMLVISNTVMFLFLLVKEPQWRSVMDNILTQATAQTKKSTGIKPGTDLHIVSSSRKLSRASGFDDPSSSVPSSTRVFGGSSISAGSINANVIRSGQATALGGSNTGYIPVAGCTGIRIVNETDPPVNSKNHIFAGWRMLPGETLLVRSHGYTTTKKKIPSPGTLYNLAAMDVFESPARIPDMAPRVKLPKVEFKDDVDISKTWRCPDHFVISIALPTDPPKLVGSHMDGGGYIITLYFTMSQETRDILKRVTADGYDPTQETPPNGDPQLSKVNAVRLLEEWVRRAPTDPTFQSRFKIVPNAHNLKEIGIPSWIGRYNGKPFLIKRAGETGFFYSHPDLSAVEFDVSLHPFPYLAKKGINYLKEGFFKRVVVTFGFVIEGKTDDELPECLIGLVQLCYPDPQYAIQAEDFFAGTSPRSYE